MLWVGVDENAVIDFGTHAITITDWVNSLDDPEWDAGFSIRSGDTSLPEAFSQETGVFGLYYDADGSGRWSPFLFQVDLEGVQDTSAPIYYDLFQWDYAMDDWKFVATAFASLGDLNAYCYERYDINPVNAQEWKPNTYHAAVPEPSPVVLMLCGLCVLLMLHRPSNWEGKDSKNHKRCLDRG